MTQVTGPIIAITLVLLSVFIPTAFIPGISGQLYSQFAVAVSVVDGDLGDQRAVAVAGALLADPAPPQEAQRGVMAWLQNGIDKTRDGYMQARDAAGPARLHRRCCWSAASSLATGGIGCLVPSGFLPDEDQGAFMAEVQLPDAASTNRTLAAVEEVEKTIAGRPWLQSIFTVAATA